jgi:putative FmdB family regulatory protein
MPIYEYRCDSCGHEKEVLQRMSDKPLTKCPKCGKRRFHKLVSAAGFQLKGTGWYATDFKNSGAKKPATQAGKPESKPDKSADSAGKDSSKPDAACGAGACPACS